jgi:hypothetical protein
VESNQESVEGLYEEDLLTPEDFSSPEEYTAYIESVDTPTGATVEVGVTGIKVDGSESLVVFVLLVIPFLYWVKKKIDAGFMK